MHLGIDLGTSNSAAAGYFGGKTRVFKTADQADVLPSVIYIDKRGNKFFSSRAYRQLAVSPENVAAGFKRQMGTSWTKEFPASGLVMTAEECSVDILKQLVLQAETESGGEKIIGTVITVPAAFNQTQMEATARAAEAAGIEKVAFLQEPIAAAMATMAQAKKRDSRFLVYDLGGGTFDLALVQSIRGSVNIIAHEGDNMLGGRDFDRIIVNNIIRPWLLENFALSDDFQKNHPKLMRQAAFAAEEAKIKLSAQGEAATIFAPEDDLRITDGNGEDIYVNIGLSRENYEPLIADEIARMVALSRRILKDNGFESGDIDKIVFIGGPCKTPFIRETVSRELGVPANMDIDPMTAVALGAAIDCETRDWSGERVTRKKTRASAQVSGPLEIQYDYPARVTDNRARVRIRLASPVAAKGCEISIESATGWTSGRSALEGDAVIEIPVDEDGENIFRIWVYDGEGKPVAEAGQEISIVRTVSSAATPTAHDLAVKIVTGEGDDARDALQSIVKKGENLPAEGVARSFRAARDIGDKFSVEFWEQPNAKNSRPESPNLFVGRCMIRVDDLPEGESIRRGDEVHIHWSVNESHLITTAVEIPRLGHMSDSRNFFSAEVERRSFEGEDGRKIADDSLRDVLGEIKAAEESAKPDNPDHVTEIRQARNEAEKLRAELRHSAGDSEEHRRVVEKARGIRGRLAGVRDESADQVHELERKLNKEVNSFNEGCREDADESAVEEFDNLAEECRESLKRDESGTLVRGESGISDARRMLERMGKIHFAVLREQPSFVIGAFKHFAQERHLALDKRQFDEDVVKGLEAIESRDFDEVREIIGRILENRVQTDEHPETRNFADIMRK